MVLLTLVVMGRWCVLGGRGLVELTVFDEGAGVHDGEEAGVLGLLGGLLVDDTELEPDGFGADSDGIGDEGGNVFTAAEEEDEVDGGGNAGEVRVGGLAEGFSEVGVDGDYIVAPFVQVGGNIVASAGGFGGKTDDGDIFTGIENLFDRLLFIHHKHSVRKFGVGGK